MNMYTYILVLRTAAQVMIVLCSARRHEQETFPNRIWPDICQLYILLAGKTGA